MYFWDVHHSEPSSAGHVLATLLPPQFWPLTVRFPLFAVLSSQSNPSAVHLWKFRVTALWAT
jgi:hypothetical protein